MKIIVLRDGGVQQAIQVSRRRLVALGSASLFSIAVLVAFVAFNWRADEVDAEVVAKWRSKLAQQDAVVNQIKRRSQAQSAAIGRQLAEMQARLLRMEAVGAQMADSAELGGEFDFGGQIDFGEPPAQGGPALGQQRTMDWQSLQLELTSLASQLRRRETELNILSDVLVSEDIQNASEVRGRPVKWGWLSSNYGNRVDPLTGKTAWHSGVDFAGHEGSDVIAVASGVVTFAGERYGYGRLVEISHANGYVTRYAHHKSLVVRTGEIVKKGETIGTMGSSGRSTGPHVHFEVLRNGRTVDPAKFVSRRS